MALLPPPTHATTASGSRPSCPRHWARASRPMTLWKSRTMHRVGVGPHHGADDVVGAVHVGHPVPDGLVDGVLEGARAAAHRAHLGPQELHPEDVEGLAVDVLLPHVDDALLVEHGADGGRGHAVLPGAGLGDDALLPHPARQEALAQGVVDLVRPRVGQVLPLEVELRPAVLGGELAGVVEGRRAPHVVPLQGGQLTLELGVEAGLVVGGDEPAEGRHQGLGDVLPPEGPEVPRALPDDGGWGDRVAHQPSPIFCLTRASVAFATGRPARRPAGAGPPARPS